MGASQDADGDSLILNSLRGLAALTIACYLKCGKPSKNVDLGVVKVIEHCCPFVVQTSDLNVVDSAFKPDRTTSLLDIITKSG